LDGQTHEVTVNVLLTVSDLKTKISTATGVGKKFQRLLSGDTEILEYRSGIQTTLQDYQIKQGSVVQLLRLLYEFANTSNLNNITFDLIWGFPKQGRDYLDATCMMYEGMNYKTIVDFTTKEQLGVTHSGDVMDTTAKTGKHIIKISLKEVAKNISHLYFILSAWNTPSIIDFKLPSVKFFDNNAPDVPLNEYSIPSAGESQAVIMCCLLRCDEGWRVMALGRKSPGNAREYTEIHKTIAKLPKM